MTAIDLRYLALGAGVQSTALYLLAHEGVIAPRPDLAIFADTQIEPPWVYDQLDWLESFGDIPIRRVTAGDLAADVLRSRDGKSRFASVPFFVPSKNGRGMLRRHCTREYKIDPIRKEVRRLLGLRPGQRAAGRFHAEEWIGISLDEAHRAKPSRFAWITTRWPLLFDLPMSRRQCVGWMESRGYPIPRKSACVICPFRSDRYWAWIQSGEPEQFDRAATFDREIRHGKLRGVKGVPYLHSSLRPLDKINFGEDVTDQLELGFGNECEGVCGV